MSATPPPGESAVAGADPIVLNAWAARELEAMPGDRVDVDYYLWDATAGLVTHSAQFMVSRVVPIAGFAAIAVLRPTIPGSQARKIWRIGIRRFRLICRCSPGGRTLLGRSTRRRRPSFLMNAVAISGDRDTAR